MFRHDTFPLAKILEVAQALLSPPECGNSTYFLRTGLSEIWDIFQNCHIWIWNLTSRKSSRGCRYTLFLPNRSKVSLFSLYRQRFPRYGPIFSFRDTERFSKLWCLGMTLFHWQKFQKLHIHSPLSTPECGNSAYFRSTDSSFRDMSWFSKLPYLGMKLDMSQNSRGCRYTLFLPQQVESEIIWQYLPTVPAGESLPRRIRVLRLVHVHSSANTKGKLISSGVPFPKSYWLQL